MKRTLTGIAAAAVVLGTLAPAAFASTAPAFTSGGSKTISLDGTTLYSGVQVGNATDAGTTTTYFPIWYLEQALQQAGYTTSYNVGTHTWDITVPGVNASSISVDGGVGTGNAAISINGTVVKKFNAQWGKDFAGGKNAQVTTYFPVYYLGNVLKAAGFTSAWDGNNFGFQHLVTTPAVTGAKVLNARQIAVTFATPVDSTTATDATMYSIKTVGAAAVGLTNDTSATGATVDLSADAKTATITLNTALTQATFNNIAEGDAFEVLVSGVKATTGATVPDSTQSVVYSDKIAPTFVSASATAKSTTNTVTLTFSEPIDYSMASVTINGSYATLSAGSAANQVTVTSASPLNAGTSYNLSLLNFKDAAGNLMNPNPVSTSVTVTTDTAAPQIKSVTVLSDSKIEVVFTKSINASTVTTASLKVLDPNSNTAGITESAVTQKANTTDTFDITLTALPFNSSGVFAGNVVAANTIQDTSGNSLTAVTQSFSVTRDTTAPTIVFHLREQDHV